METREQRRSLLMSAVDQFLDHLEEDFDDDVDYEDDVMLGSIVICAEISVTLANADKPSTIPTYWCSNENGIWQRGFFEILADYKTLLPQSGD